MYLSSASEIDVCACFSLIINYSIHFERSIYVYLHVPKNLYAGKPRVKNHIFSVRNVENTFFIELVFFVCIAPLVPRVILFSALLVPPVLVYKYMVITHRICTVCTICECSECVCVCGWWWGGFDEQKHCADPTDTATTPILFTYTWENVWHMKLT